MLEKVSVNKVPFANSGTKKKISLNIKTVKLSDKQFEHLCSDNPDLKFELSAGGELITVPPTGMESGGRNSDLNYEFVSWARKDKRGKVFDSSTMFMLPNKAKRSPDVSWILQERIEKLTLKERQGFARIVPNFVLELLSPTDSLSETQEKMREYIANGISLGWLIDPKKKRVHIYRASGEVEISDDLETISGEDVLIKFKLNIREIW